MSSAFSGMGAVSPTRQGHRDACWMACKMGVRVSLSQCTEYKPTGISPAYFNFIATGHSADLGEEAEVNMTEEGDKTK